MDKNEILKIAQETQKDERMESITTKAHKTAGTTSMLVVAILALIITYDGYILGNERSYDFLTVSLMLIGVAAINNMVFSLYELIALKKRSRIVDMIVFGVMMLWAAVRFITFWIG